MLLRRISLFVLGITGSFFVAIMMYLYISDFTAIHNADENKVIQAGFCIDKESYNIPFAVPGTCLLLQSCLPYEGPFLEDGSDREVVDIAAVLLQNEGDKEILQCGIRIWISDQCYEFYGEYIPPRATVLLLESSAKSYIPGQITDCVGWQILSLDQRSERNSVRIVEQAMGTLVISNVSTDLLRDVQVVFKTWFSENDILIGGISYSSLIPSLEPGQTVNLYPYHYVCGYSKIVSVGWK